MYWIRPLSLLCGVTPLLEAARTPLEERSGRVVAAVETDGSLHAELESGALGAVGFEGATGAEADYVEASLAELATHIGAANVTALMQLAADGSLTKEDVDRLDQQTENSPMYFCNSICAKCANGDVVYIRRSMTWAWLFFRALLEPLIVPLYHLLGGRVLSEKLQQQADKLSSWRLPNECRSVAVFRQSTRVAGNGTMVVKLSHQDYTEYPLLKILMKSMNMLARREKDAGNDGKVTAKQWFQRITPLHEKLYKEQGMVPVVVEDVVAEHFCKEGGLLREEHPDADAEEEFEDHPLGWSADNVLKQLQNHEKTSNFHDHNPFVIQQDSNWEAFKRSATKGHRKNTDKAMAQCHVVGDSFDLWAHADERKLAQREARKQYSDGTRRVGDAVNTPQYTP